eukprot:6832982-Prymnesium_polylepis.1
MREHVLSRGAARGGRCPWYARCNRRSGCTGASVELGRFLRRVCVLYVSGRKMQSRIQCARIC